MATLRGKPIVAVSMGRVLLPAADRDLLLGGFNGAKREYGPPEPLHEMVDEQARRTPDAPAVSTAHETITYRELAAESDRLAQHLQRQRTGVGHRVGIYDKRSIELVVGMLAVLKAGAAYVPLDPDHPIADVARQVRDADIAVILTRTALAGRLTDDTADIIAADTIAGTTVVPLDELLRTLPTLPTPTTPTTPLTPLTPPRPNGAAYVIYPDTSAGEPVGVVVPHRGVVNRLMWLQELFDLNERDRVLQMAPVSSDVSVAEFFWPLVCGGLLFLADPERQLERRRDARSLIDTIRRQHVTTVHFTPHTLALFLDELDGPGPGDSLRTVICGGQPLRPETVTAFFDRFPPEVELYSLYGPAETSSAAHRRYRPGDGRAADTAVTIGRPAANTRIHILGPDGELLPIGVAGELHVGGGQIATGYLRRPELTAERFVPDPFADGPLYRTGDRARYRDDGVLELVGPVPAATMIAVNDPSGGQR